MMGLAGKAALVTGAAQGLGRAFAVRLAADGADVVLVDVVPADGTAQMIEQCGRRALALIGDVSSPDDVERIRGAVTDAFGGIDILVNNAGCLTEDNFDTLDYASWRRVFAVNVDSVFLFTKAFAPGMRARGGGRIVNLCTIMLALNVPHFPHYVASKGAVLGATRAFASALADDGITVNAISPGQIRTPGTEALGQGVYENGGGNGPDRFALAAAMQSIKRVGLPRDLVGALAFLVSDEAGFITGQNLIVDGGTVRAV